MPRAQPIPGAFDRIVLMEWLLSCAWDQPVGHQAGNWQTQNQGTTWPGETSIRS